MMKNYKELDILINAYQSGEMDTDAKKAFEERLLTDNSLRQVFALHNEIDEALNDSDAKSFEAIIKDVIEKNQPAQKHSSQHFFKLRYILWSAAVVFLLLFGVFICNSKSPPIAQKLYETYYEPYPNRISRSDEKSKNPWMTAYASGNYKNAIATLEQITDRNPIEHFYLALSYLAEGKDKRALQSFEVVIDGKANNITIPSLWYKALILVKSGKQTEARIILQDLQSNSGKYGNRATLLLQDLKN